MDNPERIARDPSMRVVSIRVIFFITFLVFFTMGCRLISDIPLPENGPDVIVEATTTATPEPILRHDFNGQLNPVWTWQNEDASRCKVNEDGWLEIIGGDESILAGGQQTNLLLMSLPEGDFVISIHLKSQPLFDFQQAGILLSGDSEQYVSLSLGYCMQCVLGGSSIFLEYNLKGDRVRYAAATDATDIYLMLIRAGEIVSGFYATEAGQWRYVASLGSASRIYLVGLSVTNDSAWDEGLDAVGMFDFFEIRPSFHQKSTPILFTY